MNNKSKSGPLDPELLKKYNLLKKEYAELAERYVVAHGMLTTNQKIELVEIIDKREEQNVKG